MGNTCSGANDTQSDNEVATVHTKVKDNHILQALYWIIRFHQGREVNLTVLIRYRVNREAKAKEIRDNSHTP